MGYVLTSPIRSQFYNSDTTNRILFVGLPLIVTLGFCLGYGIYTNQPGSHLSSTSPSSRLSGSSQTALHVDILPQNQQIYMADSPQPVTIDLKSSTEPISQQPMVLQDGDKQVQPTAQLPKHSNKKAKASAKNSNSANDIDQNQKLDN